MISANDFFLFLSTSVERYASWHFLFLLIGAALFFFLYRNGNDRNARLMKTFLLLITAFTIWTTSQFASYSLLALLSPLLLSGLFFSAVLLRDVVFGGGMNIYPPKISSVRGAFVLGLVAYSFIYPDFYLLPPLSHEYPEVAMLGLHFEPLIVLSLALLAGEKGWQAQSISVMFFISGIYLVIALSPVYPEIWLLIPVLIYGAYEILWRKISGYYFTRDQSESGTSA